MATLKESSGDNEVSVTKEDQDKINKFASHNARLQDTKDELKAKQKELENLDDAGNELLAEYEGTDMISYQIGEVFVMMTSDEAGENIEKAKEELQKDIAELEKTIESNKQFLQGLKVELYAKFGNNINLEAEEE